MDKLHRLSRPHVALSDDDVFDGVLQQLCDSMVFMFGDDFNLTRVKRQIRKIEAEYGRFVRFINKPGVGYHKATNVVSIIRSYSARSSRRVSVICECYVLILLNAYSIDPCFNTNSHETSEERYFRHCGFQHYETCNIMFTEKNASTNVLQQAEQRQVQGNMEQPMMPDEDNVAWFDYITRHYRNTDYEDLPWDVIRRQYPNYDSNDGASDVTDG